VSRVCEKCGKRPVSGRTYARRGLAKYKGGVGRKITGVTLRTFDANLQVVKVKEPNGQVHRIKICSKCLKTAVRNGTILKAARKPRPPKVIAPPPAPPAPQEPETPPEEAQDKAPAEAPAEKPRDKSAGTAGE